jgi:hypothetical protein
MPDEEAVKRGNPAGQKHRMANRRGRRQALLLDRHPLARPMSQSSPPRRLNTFARADAWAKAGAKLKAEGNRIIS